MLGEASAPVLPRRPALFHEAAFPRGVPQETVRSSVLPGKVVGIGNFPVSGFPLQSALLVPVADGGISADSHLPPHGAQANGQIRFFPTAEE